MDLILNYSFLRGGIKVKRFMGMTKDKVLPYGYQDIDQDDIDIVSDALTGEFLTTGPLVENFETALKNLTDAKYAVTCSSGTAALHLACMALGIKKGDWVIVPSITFLATANAVRYCQADVLFCDVDPNTGLITPETLRNAILDARERGLKIKAVIVVHLTGRHVDLKEIKEITHINKLELIADSCHAIGGVYDNMPIGKSYYEQINTFSFHPVKAFTTGEGGAITTNNQKLASAIRQMRSHNMIKDGSNENKWQYVMNDIGYNYRLSDIQCALGISQLKKLKGFKQKRSRLVKFYNSKLQKFFPKITTPDRYGPKIFESVNWHLYSILIDFKALKISRGKFMENLRQKKINTQVHYIPVHTQPYYTKLYGSLNIPGSIEYFERTLSLPLFTKMHKDDIEFVVKALEELV